MSASLPGRGPTGHLQRTSDSLKEKTGGGEKAKEQAKRARDQSEQDGYDVGMAAIEEALRAKVSRVCRTYCLQVWNETLNQVGVEVSSILRNAESVYYPLPSEHLARPALGLRPPPRWQKRARPAQPIFYLPLTTLPRGRRKIGRAHV